MLESLSVEVGVWLVAVITFLFKAGSSVRCVVSIASPMYMMRIRGRQRRARLGSIRTGGIRRRIGRFRGPKSRPVRKATGTQAKSTGHFGFFRRDEIVLELSPLRVSPESFPVSLLFGFGPSFSRFLLFCALRPLHHPPSFWPTRGAFFRWIQQAWWPVVPRVGGAESDGVTSNYVVVGQAPGLDLGLHEDDFSVLWQVISLPILWRCCGCQLSNRSGPPHHKLRG